MRQDEEKIDLRQNKEQFDLQQDEEQIDLQRLPEKPIYIFADLIYRKESGPMHDIWNPWHGSALLPVD